MRPQSERRYAAPGPDPHGPPFAQLAKAQIARLAALPPVASSGLPARPAGAAGRIRTRRHSAAKRPGEVSPVTPTEKMGGRPPQVPPVSVRVA